MWPEKKLVSKFTAGLGVEYKILKGMHVSSYSYYAMHKQAVESIRLRVAVFSDVYFDLLQLGPRPELHIRIKGLSK